MMEAGWAQDFVEEPVAPVVGIAGGDHGQVGPDWGLAMGEKLLNLADLFGMSESEVPVGDCHMAAWGIEFCELQSTRFSGSDS